MESKALEPYDASLPIQATADASSYGLGAAFSDVIKHGSIRPVTYASRPQHLTHRWPRVKQRQRCFCDSNLELHLHCWNLM